MRGEAGGETWCLGKPGLFEALGLDLTPWHPTIRAWQEAGRTVVLVGTAQGLRGILALMADDLAKFVEALRLGRRARRVSLQNIVFSIAVLVVLIPAGVSGAVSVTVAVLVHEASELLAVANGLRARRAEDGGQRTGDGKQRAVVG